MTNLFFLFKYSLKSLSYEEESKEHAAQKIEGKRGGSGS